MSSCNTLDDIKSYMDAGNGRNELTCSEDIINQMKAGTYMEDMRQINKKQYEMEKKNLDVKMYFFIAGSLALLLINLKM